MGKYSSDGIHKGTWVAVHYDPMMSRGTYFELEDVVSGKGVPYGFTIDELRKVEQ